jgi:hypothetical protein
MGPTLRQEGLIMTTIDTMYMNNENKERKVYLLELCFEKAGMDMNVQHLQSHKLAQLGM